MYYLLQDDEVALTWIGPQGLLQSDCTLRHTPALAQTSWVMAYRSVHAGAS
jgi:hypothetical protein